MSKKFFTVVVKPSEIADHLNNVIENYYEDVHLVHVEDTGSAYYVHVTYYVYDSDRYVWLTFHGQDTAMKMSEYDAERGGYFHRSGVFDTQQQALDFIKEKNETL